MEKIGKTANASQASLVIFVKMLHLDRLSLTNFKNIEQAELDLSPRVNCFTGNNGSGKTNLLDAVHYLCMTKSFFSSNAAHHIRLEFEPDFFIVQGDFTRGRKKDTVFCGYKRNQGKQFKRNKVDYERLSDHIGLFPVVMISPYDTDLINQGGEERRKFMDSIISQYDKDYLVSLIAYNKALQQRNALLKQFQQKGGFSRDLLEIYDQQLIEHGNIIFKKRYDFIMLFVVDFQHYYDMISRATEKVNINYKSHCLGESMEWSLETGLEKDRIMGHTTQGIHRDDLEFSIKDRPIRKFGSQGQQKSMLIALKLAKQSFICEEAKVKPILLLDDIFDKLDERRIRHLLDIIKDEDTFGQVFITDTDKERMKQVLGDSGIEFRMFNVEKGVVVLEKEPHEEERTDAG